MQERKASTEEIETSFRKVIEDISPIIKKLAPLCQSIEELTSMIELAVINDGQLRLLMKEVLSKK